MISINIILEKSQSFNMLFKISSDVAYAYCLARKY